MEENAATPRPPHCPTVQMGATLGWLVSRLLIKDDADVRIIGAAGAGAGLAVAFNAPIGGSTFVFEELTSSFTPWLMVATLAAALVGATVGLAAWFAPAAVGGGEALTQAILADRYTLEGLLTVFLARFLLGPRSYAAGAPGGLFAPLLVLALPPVRFSREP